MNERIQLLKRIGSLLTFLLLFSTLVVVVFIFWEDQLGSLIFSLVIGGVGAVVSVASRIPRLSTEDVTYLCSSWWTLLTPMLIGVAMGGLLYIIFIARILTGDAEPEGGLFTSNLFPSFTKIPKADDSTLLNMRAVLQVRPATLPDLGKLVIWCFLAGYSERLVPNLLQGIEQRAPDVGGNPDTP